VVFKKPNTLIFAHVLTFWYSQETGYWP